MMQVLCRRIAAGLIGACLVGLVVGCSGGGTAPVATPQISLVGCELGAAGFDATVYCDGYKYHEYCGDLSGEWRGGWDGCDGDDLYDWALYAAYDDSYAGR